MDQRPSLLNNKKSWHQQQAEILETLELALQHLQSKQALPEQENGINRELFFSLKEIYFTQRDDADQFPVRMECNNQPDSDDQVKVRSEDKRPDFKWGYVDTLERNPQKKAKDFDIECKRLGKPPRSDHILNKEYATKGISRFITVEHKYGKSVPAGVMIGYIQSMELPHILTEVNTNASSNGIAQLTLTAQGWQPRGISKLEHQLSRLFPISPFTLHHFWVDLRQSPPSLQSTTPSNSTEIEKTTPES